jgi:hypothetical protein
MIIIKSDKFLLNLQDTKQSKKTTFFDAIIYEKN